MADIQECPEAVELDNVCKSYGSTPVLRGVHVSVCRGSIYGLLGPSGCGKTTMLRCIVGRIRNDSGTISVFGHRPGSKESGVPGVSVGYMPQELALFQELTIKETLNYFGRIYQMSKDKVNYRTNFLLEFLNLPTEWRLIQNLSGGQQRRVSFAVALLHEPPLLILDEPTVGVDPLLRQSIWEHLLEISRTGNVTVIITTHYVEEARQANRVGLMRNGKLLAEAEPQYLLTQHQLPTLEDVFLKLCQKDCENPSVEDIPSANDGKPMGLTAVETNNDNDDDSTELLYHPPKKETTSYLSALPNIYRIRALVVKNLIKMKRHLGFLVFQFIIPSIQIILFCLAIGGDPKDVPVAVFNSDNGTSVFGTELHLGREFLSFISNTSVNQVTVNDQADAINKVIDGDAWGMLYVEPEFSKYLTYRMMNAGKNISDKVIDGGSIHVRLDMTDQQIGYFLQRTFLTSFQDFEANALSKLNMNPRMASIPVEFGEPIYGSSTPNYTEYMAPGIILSICYFMAVGLTALSFVLERKEGLLDRSYVSGVNSVEIMMSHVVTQFGVMTIQVGLVLTFLIVVFHLPSKGPIIFVILLAILQGTAGMTYGFVISTICEAENTAVMMALGSFYPNLLLSGIMWPLEAMPSFLQHVSVFLPQTYATEAMRCILSRGRSITYMPVWRGYLVTLAWISIFLILAAVIMRIKRQ